MLKRVKHIEMDRRKKISLPAALFNKISLLNHENSSIASNNPSACRSLMCENHPTKKGKYSIITDDEDLTDTYFCEKCAILLASRGFQVEKIQSQAERQTVEKNIASRGQELDSFLILTAEKIESLNRNREKLSQNLDNLEEILEQQEKKGEQFFEAVMKVVEEKKKMYFSILEMKKKSLEDELNDNIGYSQQKMQLLEGMKDDIMTSHHSIVEDTPQEDYQLVMEHYRANLSEIKIISPQVNLSDTNLPAWKSVEQGLNSLLEVGQGEETIEDTDK